MHRFELGALLNALTLVARDIIIVFFSAFVQLEYELRTGLEQAMGQGGRDAPTVGQVQILGHFLYVCPSTFHSLGR